MSRKTTKKKNSGTKGVMVNQCGYEKCEEMEVDEKKV